MTELLYKELSDKVLGMAFSVHNILGPGLLESAYEGAYCVELSRAGIPFERQRVYPLHYKGELMEFWCCPSPIRKHQNSLAV